MNLRFNSQHSERGFSLLEILVAFSILALSLGVLFQIYSRGSHVTALSRDYSQALIIAQSQLATLKLTEDIPFGEESGTNEEGFDWHRRVSIYEEDESAEIPFKKKFHLVRIELDIHWQTLAREHSFILKSLRLVPVNNVHQ